MEENQPSSFQDDDMVPLSTLQKNLCKPTGESSSDEDNIPLASLLHTNPPLVSESEYDDSDADPEYEPGKCEVKRCKEDVWAACENCLILVCYDHCIEDIDSCEQHGKTTKGRRKIKKLTDKETCDKLPKQPEQIELQVGDKLEGKATENRGNSKKPTDKDTCDNISRQPEETELQVDGELEQETREDGIQIDVDDVDQPKTRRKRTRNPDGWKRNVQKRLKYTGKAYVSTTGKEKSEKIIGPSCGVNCPLKCSSRFDDEAREKIFNGYWSYGDKREQRHFILKHVERTPAMRKRVGSERRMTTMKYHFYEKDSRIQVCRNFFMNTLSVGKDFIYGALNQHNNGVLNSPKQGKHDSHNKVKDTVVQDVRDHINSFPAIDSHYCRARTQKQYLDASLSVSKMYRLYEESYKEREKASLDKYRRIFESEFNLAFHKPKKDQCETCTAYRNNPTSEEKESFEEHLGNKLKAREIKEQAKSTAQTTNIKTSCAFDMEQILLCPHGQSSSFYYKRRLGVYNFTIYDYKFGDGLCYMWPENEGRRGPNEVATCLFDYMKEKSSQGIKEIHMFSDNCGGQNRNRYVAFALWFARSQLSLTQITHTFLEKGHTETENDSIHATIERATRRIEIYTPDQWFTAVRAARVSKQPYKVKEMTAKDFVDFKSMSSNVKNLTTGDDGQKVMWSRTRQLVVKEEDPHAIFLATSYGGEPRRMDVYRRNRRSSETPCTAIELVKVSKAPGIPEAKKTDLLTLCQSGQIPNSYRHYFESLPVRAEDLETEMED